MCDAYKTHFGTSPQHKVMSPLDPGDHPETDLSPLLNERDTQAHQSLIGALQWAVSLARFDIASAVMTMSSFRAAPREGHMNRVKRICCCLSKMREGAIRVRVNEPDYSDVPHVQCDWTHSICGNGGSDPG